MDPKEKKVKEEELNVEETILRKTNRKTNKQREPLR